MKKYILFILLLTIGSKCLYAEVVSAFSVQNTYLNNGKIKLNNTGNTNIKVNLGFTRYLLPSSQSFEGANIYFKVVAFNAQRLDQIIFDLSPLYNITTTDFNAGPFGVNTSNINKTYDISIPYNSILAAAGQNLRIGLVWKSWGQTPPNGYPNGLWIWNPLYQVEIISPPVTTPPANDEFAGAISLTPSSTTSCTQQIIADFNNSTITQRSYETFGYNGGASNNNVPSSMLGDLWYKFVPINTTHEISVSQPPSGYTYSMELLTINGSEFKIIDIKNFIVAGTSSIKTSGLNIGQTYYVRLILINSSSQNKNVSLNICVSTPVIQSASLEMKVRYEYNNGFIYDGNSIGLNFTIPQNIPDTDLSFDWRIVGSDPLINGVYLYAEGSNPVNNGLYSLSNVQSRRVKVGFEPKAPQYADVPFWWFGVEVRIKHISTNTYLTDWYNDGGVFYTEL